MPEDTQPAKPRLSFRRPSLALPTGIFDPRTLEVAGVRRVGAAEAARLTGYATPGIAFRYGKMSGEVMTYDGGPPAGLYRLRPDNPSPGGPKYLSPAGAPLRAYVVSGLLSHLSEKDYIIFTEGEKKTLSLLEAGEPAIGFSGITCGLKDGALVSGALEYVNDRPHLRRAYFLGDSDTATNANFAREAVKIAKTLANRGIELFLPRLAMMSEEKGIDDVRGALGAEDFGPYWANLMAQAELVTPSERWESLYLRLLRREKSNLGALLSASDMLKPETGNAE